MEEKREVKPGQIYRHFKNKLYQIVCVAIHSETGEPLVVYQKLYGDYKVHARPYAMFLSEVDHEKYPEVTQKYRFELVEEKQEKSEVLPEPEEAQEKSEVLPEPEEGQEGQPCNPDLLRFLEAETMEEKRNLLVSLKQRMTDRLIDDIAASLDVIVEEGDLEKRYKSLLLCISTKAKFECNR